MVMIDSPTIPNKLKVDLGCGKNKPQGYVGVDSIDYSSLYPENEFFNYTIPDFFMGDKPEYNKFPNLQAKEQRGFPFKESSVDEVRAYDFIEHLHNHIKAMNMIWWMLKHNGIVDIFVPSTDGRGAFQDPTHVSFWNLNSFMYYCKEFPAYLKLCSEYGFDGVFSIISLKDLESSAMLEHYEGVENRNRKDEDVISKQIGSGVIHTHAVLKAIKE